MPGDVPQHHTARGAEMAGHPGRFEHRASIAGRRFGPHRLRRRHSNSAANRRERATSRRRERQHCRAYQDRNGHAEEQLRKAKELIVETDDEVPEPRAGGDPDHYAEPADDEGPFEVMPPDGAIAISQCLEGGNLRPLQRQRPRQRDVQDERRHEEKHDWQHEPEALKLRELVLDGPVRQLQRPRNRAQATVRVRGCDRVARWSRPAVFRAPAAARHH